MTLKNFTTTLEDGRMRTWRLPRRSALTMLFKQSFCESWLSALWNGQRGRCWRTRTDTRTIYGFWVLWFRRRYCKWGEMSKIPEPRWVSRYGKHESNRLLNRIKQVILQIMEPVLNDENAYLPRKKGCSEEGLYTTGLKDALCNMYYTEPQSHPAISVTLSFAATTWEFRQYNMVCSTLSSSSKDFDSFYRVESVQRLPREHLECSSRNSEWVRMRWRIILKCDTN